MWSKASKPISDCDLTDPLPPVASTDLDEVLRSTSPDVWEALRGRSIFLTGGTGFVGKWLLECLIHADRILGLHSAITVLTRRPADFALSSPHLAQAGIVTLVSGDITDFDFPAGGFDYVLHAALPVAPPHSGDDVLHDLAVAGATRVCEFACAAGARRMLHISSGAVYGPSDADAALAEDLPWTGADAVNGYTRAKRASEEVMQNGWPFGVVVARCFAFTGPYLLPSSGSAAADFIATAAAERPISVNGTGDAVRSYQYASDMARWLLTCLVRGRPGRTYNVGSDDAVTIGGLAQRVASLSNAVDPVRFAGRATVGLAGNRYVPDLRRSTVELGLVNAVDLDEGILRTLRWHASAKTISSSVSHET